MKIRKDDINIGVLGLMVIFFILTFMVNEIKVAWTFFGIEIILAFIYVATCPHEDDKITSEVKSKW